MKYFLFIILLSAFVSCGEEITKQGKPKECNPVCNEWETCSFEGNCIINTGKCNSDSDCLNDFKCNLDNHECFESTECFDPDIDGYGTNCVLGPDCNDNDFYTNPGVDEICGDEVDNNCNKVTDEFCSCIEGQIKNCYTGPIQTLNKGECKAGYQICEDGVFSNCRSEVLPTDELFDGFDNNCDEQIDEGFVINACGELGETPSEVCGDGLDNNCNGFIDENCGNCENEAVRTCFSGNPKYLGIGECKGGSQRCINGVWSRCEGDTLPIAEICDDKDNDCDNQTDESVKNACNQCGELPQEVCDRIDNNCDGQIDEGVSNACGECNMETPPEICDGFDNNCDGLIDEGCSCTGNQECYGGDAETKNIGECKAGTQRCIGGEYFEANCVGQIIPTIEICDGKDNDCDDDIDEEYHIGEECFDGFGICKRKGVYVCDDSKLGVRCEATGDIIVPDNEICDGLDNDCDGVEDEGFLLNISCGVGACGGLTICSPDKLSTVCDFDPTQASEFELCGDEIDNDCNGFTDEGFELLGEDCFSGLGVCRVTDQYKCSEDKLSLICEAVSNEELKITEQCGDDLDNDCDGFTDEGFRIGAYCDNDKLGGCFSSGEIICVAGEEICSAQDIEQSEEVCDGIDNDCDGSVDEGYALNVPCGSGSCSGVTICSADKLATTCSFDLSLINEHELCGDGIDNNCNGFIDEGFELVEENCSAGLGVCKNAGVYQCSTDKLTMICSATANTDLQATEKCGDNIDNDCDGFTDEGFRIGAVCTNNKLGACLRTGEISCSNGAEVCSAQDATGSAEVCDGIDNDCDGTTDEGYTLNVSCGQGSCSGVMICTPDKLSTTCSFDLTYVNANELCGDGYDNDCDGFVDEGFELVGDSCNAGLGVCKNTGIYQCSANKLTMTCSATANTNLQTTEKCGDNLDNDCDGFTDEGFRIGAFCDNDKLGLCYRTGTIQCTNGAEVCSAPNVNGTAELCDGVDNDCDGSVDETFPTLYSVCYSSGLGICSSQGVNVCNSNQNGVTCNATQGTAGTEICDNGLDDDCDGLTDYSDTQSCTLPTYQCGTSPSNPVIFERVNLASTITGTPEAMFWEVIAQPTGSSVVLTTPTSAATSFVPLIAGTYNIKWTVVINNTEYSCNYNIFIQPSDSLNVSALWETASDVDLHLLKAGSTVSDWETANDCYYNNCRICPLDVTIPGQTCSPNHQLNWFDQISSEDDPQLDIDNRIGCANGTCYPENVSIEQPYELNASTHYLYTIAVHYYSGKANGREGDSGANQNVDVTIYCRDNLTSDITEYTYRCPNMAVGQWCFVRDIDWSNGICTTSVATRQRSDVSKVTPVVIP